VETCPDYLSCPCIWKYHILPERPQNSKFKISNLKERAVPKVSWISGSALKTKEQLKEEYTCHYITSVSGLK
jgi:hypothetical protein